MLQPITIDVSDLPPPEPMTEILKALSTLPVNMFLQVMHRREPIPLYEKLPQLGFSHKTISLGDGSFQINIYRISEADLL